MDRPLIGQKLFL